jgi:hypothetical protein
MNSQIIYPIEWSAGCFGYGENKQKGDNEGGLLKTLPSQQSRV